MLWVKQLTMWSCLHGYTGPEQRYSTDSKNGRTIGTPSQLAIIYFLNSTKNAWFSWFKPPRPRVVFPHSNGEACQQLHAKGVLPGETSQIIGFPWPTCLLEKKETSFCLSQCVSQRSLFFSRPPPPASDFNLQVRTRLGTNEGMSLEAVETVRTGCGQTPTDRRSFENWSPREGPHASHLLK